MSESLHPRADELDGLSALEFAELMNLEDAAAVQAMRPQLGQVARAIQGVAERLRSGGRLHYFGAGSSGLIARLDASECPDTFGVPADLVQAHAAPGGANEDDPALGVADARAARLGGADAVVGISASGRTPYVIAALDQARADGALVVTITCRAGSPLATAADIAIELETGPELIAGSTRLKAGTAQKLALNMLSTGVFTRLAHTHRGRMVGVTPANAKLRDRAAGVVADLGRVAPDEAARALSAADGSVKLAIVMLRNNIGVDEARARLAAAQGDLGAVLSEGRRA